MLLQGYGMYDIATVGLDEDDDEHSEYEEELEVDVETSSKLH
jgi:hypothetical protein